VAVQGEIRPTEGQELADERRTQILQAALACMARSGYAGTTMDDIAREAGLSKGALYWYFASKREVFLALMQDTLEKMTRQAGKFVADTTLSPSERLFGMLDTIGRLLEAEEEVLLVTMDFWAFSRHDAEFVELFRVMYGDFLRIMESVLAEGIASGEFRPVNPLETGRLLLGMLDGLLFQAALGLPVDWEQVSVTLRGLLWRQPMAGGSL